MSLSQINDCILKSDLITQRFIHELTSLRGKAEDVFIDDCLVQFSSSKQPPNFFPLIEFVREKLNTGHWCDVPNYWRSAYAILRIASALNHLTTRPKSDLALALWEIDDALIMGHNSKLHGGMTLLASLIHALIPPSTMFSAEYLQPSYHPLPDQQNAFSGEVISRLQRVDRPSVTEFLSILNKGEPVIITGSMTHWPACDDTNKVHFWSLAHWSHCAGNRTVPIEVGSAYTDESWGQRLMTIDRFISTFIVNASLSPSKGYLAQHQIFLQIPELGEEVDIPEYCYLGTSSPTTTVDSNIWFGPEGTISPLHHDSNRANLLCQVVGKKYVRLYQADQTNMLFPHKEEMLSNTSQVNVENPDLDKHPLFEQARGFHGILAEKEMLYIPPRCWHYLRSLSTSISLNFWWPVDKEYIPDWSEGYLNPI